MQLKTIFNETEHDISLNTQKNEVQIGDQTLGYEFTDLKNGRFLLSIGHQTIALDDVRFEKKDVEFLLNGDWQKVTVLDEQDLLMEKMGFKSAEDIGEGELKAPMPGKILEILHQAGDEVELGEPLAILEAMKMENELKAPMKGIIESIDVEVGQNVEKGEPILEIKASG